jgi:hypothetical protein
LQAQSDDDDVGPDDMAVNVEGRDGFMDEFFAEVRETEVVVCAHGFNTWGVGCVFSLLIALFTY